MSKRSRVRARSFPVRLRESTATVVDAAPTLLREASTDGIAETGTPRRYRARLIETDRWGSSGWYGRDVIGRDGPTAWPIGTHLYVDHPKASDEIELPERSIRDIGAHITSTPVLESDGLYADIEVVPHHAAMVHSLRNIIGLSIRADGFAESGTRQGRTGPVVTAITHGISVDLVTKAGAGGRIISLLESARATALTEAAEAIEPATLVEPVEAASLREARNIGAWLESRLHLNLTTLADDMYGDGRLTREERIALSTAIGKGLQAYTAEIQQTAPQLFERDLWAEPTQRAAIAESARLRESTSDQIRAALTVAVRDAHSAEHTWCWVRDYDADRGLVWFDVEASEEGCATYQQAYTTTGADAAITAALIGERVAVVAQTVYVPAVADTPSTDLPLYENAELAEPNTADVTDGAPPTGSTTPTTTEEGPDMSGTSTGAIASAPAGTAPVVDTAAFQIEAREAATARDKATGERDTALREAATEKARADKAEAELALFRAVESARPLIAAQLAESGLPAAAQNAVTAYVTERVPLTESRHLDQNALRGLVEARATAEKAYVAQLQEAAGAGQVTGFGQAPAQQAPAAASWAAATESPNTDLIEAYRARGLDAKAAEAAARGRSV